MTPHTPQCDRARLDTLFPGGYEQSNPENAAVTAATTFKPLPRGESDPALLAAAATGLIAAATLAGAWFFQLVLDIQPCPLCLEQRYAFYLQLPLAVLLAIAAWQRAPRGLLVAGLAVLALAALGNAGLGAYHAGVEWRFWPGPTDCSGPVVNLGSAGSLLDRLSTVKVIRCDEVQFRFLGISLAGYNVLISLAIAAIAGWGIAKTAKA
jgi:disulfide bond formation protein DsbB